MNKLLVALILTSIGFGEVKAQIVPVGSGSYAKTFPGVDEAGRNGYPRTSPLLSGTAATKPIPTNDWWSSLLKNDIFGGANDFAENLFNYPLSMKTTNTGLVVTYIPFGVIDDQNPVVVGVRGLNASQSTVSDHSDWIVTINWDNRFQAITGTGMPFVYFNKGKDEVATVTVSQGSVQVDDEIIIVTDAGNGADFVIYAPSGSTWTQNGNTCASTLNGQNYWSMAMLPQSRTNIAELAVEYKKYAYVFPVDTKTEWTYNESTGSLRTEFTIETEVKEGTATNMLMGLLPHQSSHLTPDSPTPQGYVYNSVRGDIKTLEGNAFFVENTFHGILPTLPYLTNSSEGFSLSTMVQKIQALENDQLAIWTDSYNEGQMMNRLVQTARIAHEMGYIVARDKMLDAVKERLEDWLTAQDGEVAFLFYYHEDWTALLGYPGGHGQDTNINDHHFHWGYFIHAAAFLEQFRPGWADEWGEMINLLVRDAASPDRDDPLFPYLRNFSPYAGHCWANGMAAFPQGNDQESTSESMQFNSALIHWGTVTGNDEIRDLGIYLYTTEQSAIEEYWFDMEERIFPENQYSLVSRVWGNAYDNGTFWTSDIEASYGIQLYPIHGGSMYLGHDTTNAKKIWTKIETYTGILGKDDNPNLWHDTMWKYLAFTDPEKAILLYDAYPERNLKFGISDAQTYYWIHAMNALGAVENSITADYPIAVAFQKNGLRTYVAHNYYDKEIDVNFSDGFVLTVPAQSMVTNRDTSIEGEISSSFASAYPGGSVELSINTSGEIPTSVEFYDDDQFIGEDISPPFNIKATNLVAGVHGFYAKIFIDKSFGVSNIAEVIVGEQQPYNGTNSIPGIIEAGHYDTFMGGSGQGITYFDVTAFNEGDFRKDEGVDAGLSDSEGATVGWINAGEWLEYTIEVSKSGIYSMSFRFASESTSGGGPFHLELNGEAITDNIMVGNTSGWDDWQSIEVNGLSVHAGKHILRVAFEGDALNLGRMTFTFEEDLPYGHPIANAGDNVSVLLSANFATLDGSQSNDPDDDSLTYHWDQIFGPSVMKFSDNTISNPMVTNLETGVYKCRLTVSDGNYSSMDDVLVIVSETGNLLPIVTITSPKNNASFEEGGDITIEASASDLEGNIVSVGFFDGEKSISTDNTVPFV